MLFRDHRESGSTIAREVNEIVCHSTTPPVQPVNEWYAESEPVNDRETRWLLEVAELRMAVHAT